MKQRRGRDRKLSEFGLPNPTRETLVKVAANLRQVAHQPTTLDDTWPNASFWLTVHQLPIIRNVTSDVTWKQNTYICRCTCKRRICCSYVIWLNVTYSDSNCTIKTCLFWVKSAGFLTIDEFHLFVRVPGSMYCFVVIIIIIWVCCRIMTVTCFVTSLS